MTADGWVHVSGNAPQRFDQGKGFMNNGDLCIDQLGGAVVGYVGGLPVTATGALKCQLNQPVSPGDAYVGGLRVGPLGGLYIVDAAPVWTPANLFASGEQGAWYDPSDLSTMFQDSAGTTPVTATGQTVGKILDKSGRGNHASQATAASRPVLQQDGNGKYYLGFDGVDDSLATAAIDFTATDKMNVFCGTTRSATSSAIMLELSATANANIGSFYITSPHDATEYGLAAAGSAGGSAGGVKSLVTTTGVAYVVTGLFDLLKTLLNEVVIPRLNGAASVGSNIGVVNRGGNFGNYPLYLGRRGGASLPFNGRIYSIIVRGALSTTQEITDTENWVNSKTGAY
jgi:hypothetical protein